MEKGATRRWSAVQLHGYPAGRATALALLLTAAALLLMACDAGPDFPAHVEQVSPPAGSGTVFSTSPGVRFDMAAGAGVAADRAPLLAVNGEQVHATWTIIEDLDIGTIASVERLELEAEQYTFQVWYWDTTGEKFTYIWAASGLGGPDSPVGPAPTPVP